MSVSMGSQLLGTKVLTSDHQVVSNKFGNNIMSNQIVTILICNIISYLFYFLYSITTDVILHANLVNIKRVVVSSMMFRQTNDYNNILFHF